MDAAEEFERAEEIVDEAMSDGKPPHKPLRESIIRISLWDGKPLPERKWAIQDCVPAYQICGFFGEGGSGKSILELMKDAAHVLGQNWLSFHPALGPAVYMGAEDHTNELHIRIARVAEHYDTTLTELEQRGLYLICRYGDDSVLCEPAKNGRIVVTKLYRELYELVGDVKPKNVSLELSRVYIGSELDRVQVNQLAEHLQALALLTDAGSVTLLGHPSLTGISTGSGSSGSTGWHGSFRARCFLRGIKKPGDDDFDNDVRELVFRKNQYGAMPESIVLRFSNGLWLPDAGITDFEKELRKAKAAEVFLALLKKFTERGDKVSHKPRANNYAPKEFAKAAAEQGIRKSELEAVMNRLLDDGKIKPEPYGAPSKDAHMLVIQ